MLAAPAFAGTWQWRDASGRMVYSDLPPPPSVPASQILRAPTPATPIEQSSAAPAQATASLRLLRALQTAAASPGRRRAAGPRKSRIFASARPIARKPSASSAKSASRPARAGRACQDAPERAASAPERHARLDDRRAGRSAR
ncbi:MAG: DUF4124 domain-containing protein [Burkholderiaceae bacterium]